MLHITISPTLLQNQDAEREKLREFPQSGMKRDKSLLFTAVPEEDHSMISPPSQSDQALDEVKRPPQKSMPDVVPFTNKPRQRPTKLSLSFKTQKSVDEEEIKENMDIVFTGQTSVCSTPMVEYKRLHGNILSICQNPDGQAAEKELEPDVLKNIENSSKLNVIENEKRDNKIVLDINCIGDHFINKPEPIRKLASIADIHDTFKRFSNRATAKFKSKISPIADDDSTLPDVSEKHNLTINDPSFPVFRNDGIEISESLFNQYLEQHYLKMKDQDLSKEDNMFTYNMKLCEHEKFEGFDSEMTKSPQRTPKKIPKDSTKTLTDQTRRKSLSLPLKSLNDSSDSQPAADSDAFKKTLTGVQLTPLMEKLSYLAFSDKSSGYGSRVMTPIELREFPTPSMERHVTFPDR